MNETLILVWVAIAIVGIVSIIAVKLYYKNEDDDDSDNGLFPTKDNFEQRIASIKNRTLDNSQDNPISNLPKTPDESNVSLRKEGTKPNKNFGSYIVPEDKDGVNTGISYESPNQVLMDYGSTVRKFQEPIKDNQMDIMTQNKNTSEVKFKKSDKHELKDLFTIDELIKESKRKDDEREKESKIINKEKEDNSEIKESIKKMQEEKRKGEINLNDTTTDNNSSKVMENIERMHEIADAINSTNNIDTTTPPTASQKDIDEAISSATANKDVSETVNDAGSITEALTANNNGETTLDDINVGIKSPVLKTPNKVDNKDSDVTILPGDNDYEFGAPLDVESDLFGNETDSDEMSDLDYRKDLERVSNRIKSTKLFQEVKERFAPEEEPYIDKDMIRDIESYDDEFRPIINETHTDYREAHDERLREENTRKIFPQAQENPISTGPAKSSIKVLINNNEETLKKGDEIIFKHKGETYSSKVYAIKGNNISVRYRRKDITIKPEDVKKIY